MPFVLQIFMVRYTRDIIKVNASQWGMLKRTIEETSVSIDHLRFPDAQPGSSSGPGSKHNVRSGEELVERASVGANTAFSG